MAGRGEVGKAAEVAETMAHPDFVYAGIAVQQAMNDEAAAAQTLEKIDFPTARVSALQHIATRHIENEEKEQAVQTLRQAVESAAEIEHDEEKIRTFCDIGNLFIEAGQNDEAIKTFESALGFAEELDNIHRDFFLVNCSLGILFAGDHELADSTLDLVTDKTQMASALLGFARDEWSRDEKEDALDTLEEAFAIVNSQREAETRDSRSRNTLLASIASQFAGFGKTERGIEIASQNPDPQEEMAALSQIAQILIVQKEDEQARQTVNIIKEDANRLFALLGISDAKAKMGDEQASIMLLADAAALAETVPQLGPRANVMNEIALRWIGHNRPEEASALSHETLKLITEIRDESTRAVELANLSSVRERTGTALTDDEKNITARLTRSV
jgi:tetratricopeptide (TPR) repeat protein